MKLRGLVSPDTLVLEPGWPWWMWALIAAIVVTVIILIVVLARKQPAGVGSGAPVDRSLAYRRAIEEIEHSSTLPAQEAATRISGAIRLYLATVCDDPSLFETHEEFLGRHEALKNFPEEVRTKVSTVLGHLAAMKYNRPDSQVAPVLGEQSRTVIEELHQRIPA